MKRSSKEKYLILGVIILMQIILYYPFDWHINLDIVTFIEGILRLPNAPFFSILLFTAAYALFSKDEKLSFIAGFLSWITGIAGWIISGRYYGPLAFLVLEIGIAAVYGLAGRQFVRLDKRYNFKIDLTSFVFKFLGLISLLVTVRISIGFLQYIIAMRGFPSSHDIKFVVFALIGSAVFGTVSFLVCGEKRYPEIFKDLRHQNAFEWAVRLSVLAIIVSTFYIVLEAMHPHL